MSDKPYSQMKQEFLEFYYKEVKKRLPKYLEMRRVEGPMQMAFWGVWCSFPLLFVFPIFHDFIDKFVWLKIPAYVCLGIIIIILAISVITLIVLTSMTPDSPNQKGGTRYIQHDLEMELKKDLMPKFVNIFFQNGSWYKESNYNSQSRTGGINNQTHSGYSYKLESFDFSDSNRRIENLRNLKILNPYPWERYDDVIYGWYKNVQIKIYEVNTKILLFTEIAVILFMVIILSCIFQWFFMIIFIPLFLIFILIFSFKILQYSLFKGVIVEFNFNKNIKGHTFFHENSFTAKKIPFNKHYYRKVNLESVTFENKYNVYSNDQIEARYILTPSLMERIENLKFAFKAKYVRGSFKDNKLYLAIHTGKDMFAMGSDFKDSDFHTFETLYNEMLSVLKIVEELKLNEYTGL